MIEGELTPFMGGSYIAGLVSVIIPTYNREGLTIRSLNSVYDQSYRPIEVIVIDDGSTDSTALAAEEWASRHKSSEFNVNVIRKKNAGAPGARNDGLRVCCGEFIQFLDSDDVLVPQKIEKQTEALQSHPHVSYAWSASITIAGPDTAGRWPDDDIWDFAICDPSAIPANIGLGIFRREACVRIGPWNESLKRFQDWDYSIRYISLQHRSIRSGNVGYIIFSHQEKRISDINTDKDAVVKSLFKVAQDVQVSVGECAFNVVAVKIAQKYSSALVLSIGTGNKQHRREAISQIREILPFYSSVRLKNEMLYFASICMGRSLVKPLVDRAIGMQRKRRRGL